MRLDQTFRHIGQAVSGQRGAEHLRGRVEGDLAVDAPSVLATAFLELPGVETAMGGQP